MSGIQVTMPLQMLCRLMAATQVGENMTLPLKWNPTMGKNDILPTNREPDVVDATKLPAIPSDYVKFPEIGFAYKLSTGASSVNDARETCLKERGQLAVIDSKEKADKVRSNFNYEDMIWVGLSQFHDTKKWITIDGKSPNNLPWGDGEPYGDYTCGALSKSRNGLRNMPCDRVYPYLCELALPRN